MDTWSKDLNIDFMLDNCLFGAVKLTKNADPDKYGDSGYGIGFDACSQFSLLDCSWGKNVIIFGVDNSFFVYVHNKKKNILVLGESTTQDLDNTTITAAAKCSINFSYNFLYVIATKMYQFKAKDSNRTIYTVFR